MSARGARMLGPGATALAVVAATQQPVHALAFGALALIAAAVGPTLSLSRDGERLVTAFVTIGAGVLAAFTVPPDPRTPALLLSGVPCIVATAAAAAGLARAAFRAPEGGTRAGFVFTVVALLTMTQFHGGAGLRGLVAAALGAGLMAMRLDDPGRAPLRTLGPRAWAAGAVVVGGAALFTATAAEVLPRAYAAAIGRISAAYGEAPATGLDNTLQLDALSSLMQSDEVVLRLHGPATDRLRGAVYDRYDAGDWRSTRGSARTVFSVPRSSPASGRVVRVERVGGVRGWVLLPLGARELSLEEGRARVDPLGAVRSLPGDPAERWSFALGGGADFAPSGPTASDLVVPAALRARLLAHAERLGVGGATPFERVQRIESRLRSNYRYAVSFVRTPRTDPVIDFLERHGEGHCEYFASALALLARASGVPARVVGGYRVAERNGLGGWWIVREKNAHSWVEAWDPSRGWVALDATPSLEVPQNLAHRSGAFASLGDAAVVYAQRLRAWTEQRSLAQRLGFAFTLLLGWLAWRAWRGEAPPEAVVDVVVKEPPLPAWTTLDAALSARGLPRAPSETLEDWARRIETADLLAPSQRVGTASVIRSYAALRYGPPDAADRPGVERLALEAARALR